MSVKEKTKAKAKNKPAKNSKVAAVDTPDQTPGSDQATFYYDVNYGGKSRKYDRDQPINLHPSGVNTDENDEFDSVKVGSNVKAIVHEHGQLDTEGEHRVYMEDQPEIDCGNGVSSLIVIEKFSELLLIDFTDSTDAGVTMTADGFNWDPAAGEGVAPFITETPTAIGAVPASPQELTISTWFYNQGSPFKNITLYFYQGADHKVEFDSEKLSESGNDQFIIVEEAVGNGEEDYARFHIYWTAAL